MRDTQAMTAPGPGHPTSGCSVPVEKSPGYEQPCLSDPVLLSGSVVIKNNGDPYSLGSHRYYRINLINNLSLAPGQGFERNPHFPIWRAPLAEASSPGVAVHNFEAEWENIIPA